ncbi:MAG: hypothetical protein HY917_03350 [Candidatus Diapherotrites archaeon]|nr:hypothetical protein [Candidatus Diapherotrites archaeon]
MDNEKTIAALLVLTLAAGIILLFLSFPGEARKTENTAQNFEKLTAQENPDDICAVPAGTDPKEWKDHLSHHPDRYAKCL